MFDGCAGLLEFAGLPFPGSGALFELLFVLQLAVLGLGLVRRKLLSELFEGGAILLESGGRLLFLVGEGLALCLELCPLLFELLVLDGEFVRLAAQFRQRVFLFRLPQLALLAQLLLFALDLLLQRREFRLLLERLSRYLTGRVVLVACRPAFGFECLACGSQLFFRGSQLLGAHVQVGGLLGGLGLELALLSRERFLLLAELLLLLSAFRSLLVQLCRFPLLLFVERLAPGRVGLLQSGQCRAGGFQFGGVLCERGGE